MSRNVRGYKVGKRPYLTGEEESDFWAFWISMVLYFGFCLFYTTYALYEHNVSPMWESASDVRMSPVAMLTMLVYVPCGYYLVQMLRSLILYVLGRDIYMSEIDGRVNPFTFDIHAGIDCLRGIMYIIAAGAAMGIINAVMQHTSLRENAYDYGIMITQSYFVLCVALPLTILSLRKIRSMRLAKLQTYRELGGEEWD